VGIELLNIDCKLYMSTCKDKQFDLAIVDPPYGGGQHFNFRYGVDDQVYENRKPDHEYWQQLFRISKNQIVWGGNYFTNELPENRCWISWFKGNPLNSFSDFELAWTSFDMVAKAIKLESYGFNHADKRANGQSTIHPTQKPIALYRWLLENFAEPGQKLFDSHGGSMSIACAAADLKYEIVVCEKDPKHYQDAVKRYSNHIAQTVLF